MKLLSILFLLATAPIAYSQRTDSLQRQFHLKDLRQVTVFANGHKFHVWVMNTREKEAEGMMWLVDGDVHADEGMIFVFPDSKPRAFWMHNTLIPLDIVYISEKRKVVSVAAGKAQDDTSLPSAGPAMYVVELKRGAARKAGIKPGTVFTIPGDLKAG
jgi:uncharacterized membrane protein (UPF0127 family)